jgi:hypothetical protein
MLRAVKLTPYNFTKHQHYLTVAERVVLAHRDALRGSDA